MLHVSLQRSSTLGLDYICLKKRKFQKNDMKRLNPLRMVEGRLQAIGFHYEPSEKEKRQRQRVRFFFQRVLYYLMK
jgi:hypothetical protein